MADLVYNSFKGNVMGGKFDLETEDVNVALLTGAYTPDKDAHETWGDISANEASGTGYTAGGQTLATDAVTIDDVDDEGVYDASDVTWSNSTIDAYYAAIYDSSNTDKDLVALFDFGATKSSSNGDFKIEWNSEGLVNLG